MSDLKIFASLIEDEAKEQIDIISKHIAFADQKIRIMPDVHAGKGCVVGFTSTLGDFIVPNIVGVDLGCGMLTIELGQIDIDFAALDKVIKNHVPYGRSIHAKACVNFKDIEDLKCYSHIKQNIERFNCSIGSLGGGNHFIEVNKSINEQKYLVIHSGSRNLGLQVATYYQDLAYRTLKVTDKDLAYLYGKNKEDYLHDIAICQHYADVNRKKIASIISEALSIDNYSSFTTIHNYIDIDMGIIRKGAISARKDEKLLIPLNMRDGSIIAIGKGNSDWNCSAPHGAGRLMSRTKAKTSFSLSEYQETMSGIYTSSINKNTLDEIPMAYKPMNIIIDEIKDTVQLYEIIKPIYNFKAND